jgi:hypothetical protein
VADWGITATVARSLVPDSLRTRHHPEPGAPIGHCKRAKCWRACPRQPPAPASRATGRPGEPGNPGMRRDPAPLPRLSSIGGVHAALILVGEVWCWRPGEQGQRCPSVLVADERTQRSPTPELVSCVRRGAGIGACASRMRHVDSVVSQVEAPRDGARDSTLPRTDAPGSRHPGVEAAGIEARGHAASGVSRERPARARPSTPAGGVARQPVVVTSAVRSAVAAEVRGRLCEASTRIECSAWRPRPISLVVSTVGMDRARQRRELADARARARDDADGEPGASRRCVLVAGSWAGLARLVWRVLSPHSGQASSSSERSSEESTLRGLRVSVTSVTSVTMLVRALPL